MGNEYCRVRRRWRNTDQLPWLWSHFPKVPPCSIIPSYWQPGEKDQLKRKFYDHHCATLQQSFWRNENVLEDPERYFEAVSKLPEEIKCMIPLSKSAKVAALTLA
jgi:hypothetical protein